MHLFLTGEKRVGKSTVVKRLLAELPLALGGFYTVRTETLDPSQPSVHMLHAGGDDVPSADNLLFYCLEAGGAKTANALMNSAAECLKKARVPNS